jgi:hypothetical protein
MAFDVIDRTGQKRASPDRNEPIADNMAYSFISDRAFMIVVICDGLGLSEQGLPSAQIQR